MLTGRSQSSPSCQLLVKIEYLSMNTKQFWQFYALFNMYVSLTFWSFFAFHILFHFLTNRLLLVDLLEFNVINWCKSCKCCWDESKVLCISYYIIHYCSNITTVQQLQLKHTTTRVALDNMSLLLEPTKNQHTTQHNTIIMMMITKCVTLLTPIPIGIGFYHCIAAVASNLFLFIYEMIVVPHQQQQFYQMMFYCIAYPLLQFDFPLVN